MLQLDYTFMIYAGTAKISIFRIYIVPLVFK